ncbi:MAG: 30S ribosomal protein S4e, partial [Thaumarchaeota archaeon]
EILDHLRLEKGNIAIVIGGRNVGRVGRIVEVKQVFKRASSIVSLVDKDENVFHTSLNYIFVIGRDKPAISLPEGAWK